MVVMVAVSIMVGIKIGNTEVMTIMRTIAVSVLMRMTVQARRSITAEMPIDSRHCRPGGLERQNEHHEQDQDATHGGILKERDAICNPCLFQCHQSPGLMGSLRLPIHTNWAVFSCCGCGSLAELPAPAGGHMFTPAKGSR